MTKDEILKIKEHIEIHARREHRAIIITEILWKAVDELERIEELEKENERLQQQIEKMKCCFNCAHFSGGFMCVFRCEKDDEIRKSVVTKKDVKKAICNNWRLAE